MMGERGVFGKKIVIPERDIIGPLVRIFGSLALQGVVLLAKQHMSEQNTAQNEALQLGQKPPEMTILSDRASESVGEDLLGLERGLCKGFIAALH
jgi:hypothetical protein